MRDTPDIPIPLKFWYNTPIHTFLALLGLPLLPAHAWAITIVPPSHVPGGGGDATVFLAMQQLVAPLRLLFFGVAFCFMFIYAVTLIIGSYDESAQTNARQSYLYAIAGALVVAASSYLAQTIAPGIGASADGSVIRYAIITPVIRNVLAFIMGAAAIALLANIMLQAYRLISSRGQDEYITRATTRLTSSIIGAILIVLANPLLDAITPETTILTAGSANMGGLIIEGIGLANFILTVIGYLAVLSVLGAGAYLLISVDESYKDKAKNLIRVSVITLVVVLISYAVIRSFANIPGLPQG